MALASALSVWIHASPAPSTAGFTNNRGSRPAPSSSSSTKSGPPAEMRVWHQPHDVIRVDRLLVPVLEVLQQNLRRADPGEGHDLPARDLGLVVLIGHPVDVERPHLLWSQTPVRCLDALGAAVSLGASRIPLLIGALVERFIRHRASFDSGHIMWRCTSKSTPMARLQPAANGGVLAHNPDGRGLPGVCGGGPVIGNGEAGELSRAVRQVVRAARSVRSDRRAVRSWPAPPPRSGGRAPTTSGPSRRRPAPGASPRRTP